MTARNKKILWWTGGAVIAVLVLLYIFCPPVHRLGNALLGRNEKELPQPDTLKTDDYEYGRPVEELEVETIEVPKDSLLDSLMLTDSLVANGIVKPIVGPPPAHVEGFGEGPLPPAPSVDDLPNTSKEAMQEITPVAYTELEPFESTNSVVSNKIRTCRSSYNKLVKLYNDFTKTPTAELQEQGAKRKEDMLNELTQLMKLSQAKNDDAGMEEAANLRREVNKMNF